jgi:hypothetical protein
MTAIATTDDSATDCEIRPFANTLWFAWVVVAMFNCGLSIAVTLWVGSLQPRGNGLAVALGLGMLLLFLHALLVPVTATAQWLVLRRALRDLGWWIWFAACAFGALMAFIDAYYGSLSAPPSASPAAAAVIRFLLTLATGTATAFATTMALAWAARGWPRAFFVCAILAVVVSAPLHVVQMFFATPGPTRSALVAWIAALLRDSATVLREREFIFLQFNLAWLIPDLRSAVVGMEIGLKMTAVAVSAVITGYGLRLVCEPAATAPVERPRGERLRNRQALAIVGAVAGVLLLFANRDISYRDQAPPYDVSTGRPILAFDFEVPFEGPAVHSIMATAWSSDGRFVTVAYSNGLLRRIDLAQKRVDQEITLEPEGVSLALSPDGRALAVIQNNKFHNTPEGRRTFVQGSLLLLDAASLHETARRSMTDGGCRFTSTPKMMFRADGISLWVGCLNNSADDSARPVAIRLGIPDLASAGLVRIDPTLAREGNETSVLPWKFLSGSRDILIVQEATGERVTRVDQVEDPSRRRMAARIVDLDAGIDMAPPFEMPRDGAMLYTMPESRLARDGKRLVMTADPVVPPSRKSDVTDAQLDAATVTRIYDLETGQLTNEPSQQRSSGFWYRHLGVNAGLLIDARGFYVGANAQRRSARIIVVDETTGVELQRIESVGQAPSVVSPDGRWLMMRKRENPTLRFYHVQD